MQTPQSPGWGFPCSVSGFCATSHDALGVSWQGIGRMVGAGATGARGSCAASLGGLDLLTVTPITGWNAPERIALPSGG